MQSCLFVASVGLYECLSSLMLHCLNAFRHSNSIVWMLFCLFIVSAGLFECLSPLMLDCMNDFHHLCWILWMSFITYVGLYECLSSLMLDCNNAILPIHRLSWISFSHFPPDVFLIPNGCLCRATQTRTTASVVCCFMYTLPWISSGPSASTWTNFPPTDDVTKLVRSRCVPRVKLVPHHAFTRIFHFCSYVLCKNTINCIGLREHHHASFIQHC
jgi:multidrug transporter EmrE-like cation transporter